MIHDSAKYGSLELINGYVFGHNSAVKADVISEELNSQPVVVFITAN